MAFAFLMAAAAAMPGGSNLREIVVTAVQRTFHGVVVPDLELARMRGGLRLPNGLDVSLGIDIQTRVNGLLALHTVYASEGLVTGVRVFADGANPVPIAPTTQTVSATATPGTPTLIVDRSPTGTTIIPSINTPAATVNLVNGDQSTWLSGDGQQQIPVQPNGPAIATPNGDVRLMTTDAGTVVTLQTPTLLVRQLLGQATGIVVANTANDQTINTISSVNVDLQGISPELLSSTFVAQRAALERSVMRP
jgi:hypothetical protein